MSNNNTLNKYSSLSHPDIQFIISYLKQEEQRIKDNIEILEETVVKKNQEISNLVQEEDSSDNNSSNINNEDNNMVHILPQEIYFNPIIAKVKEEE